MVVGQLARSKLLWVIGILLVILLAYLALGIFGVQTLFYDTKVNEEFALNPPASEGQESSRATNPAIVSSGEFHAVAHEGTGDAIVYRLEDGSHVLRLEAVMNSIRNGLGMRQAGNRGGPGQPENPHSNAVFTQVHNTVNTL